MIIPVPWSSWTPPPAAEDRLRRRLGGFGVDGDDRGKHLVEYRLDVGGAVEEGGTGRDDLHRRRSPARGPTRATIPPPTSAPTRAAANATGSHIRPGDRRAPSEPSPAAGTTGGTGVIGPHTGTVDVVGRTLGTNGLGSCSGRRASAPPPAGCSCQCGGRKAVDASRARRGRGFLDPVVPRPGVVAFGTFHHLTPRTAAFRRLSPLSWSDHRPEISVIVRWWMSVKRAFQGVLSPFLATPLGSFSRAGR